MYSPGERIISSASSLGPAIFSEERWIFLFSPGRLPGMEKTWAFLLPKRGRCRVSVYTIRPRRAENCDMGTGRSGPRSVFSTAAIHGSPCPVSHCEIHWHTQPASRAGLQIRGTPCKGDVIERPAIDFVVSPDTAGNAIPGLSIMKPWPGRAVALQKDGPSFSAPAPLDLLSGDPGSPRGVYGIVRRYFQ
jgi:hypothetical protein